MLIYVLTQESGQIEGWSSTPCNVVNEVEIEIPDDASFFNDNPFLYKLVDGQLLRSSEIELNVYKQAKDNELNKSCKDTILAGFLHSIDGVEYWFSFDSEAQANFLGTRPLLKEGLIPSINWTVRRGGSNGEYTRIPVTSEIMDGLTIAILMHKDRTISRYRDELLPRVYSATSIEEVLAVRW